MGRPAIVMQHLAWLKADARRHRDAIYDGSVRNEFARIPSFREKTRQLLVNAQQSDQNEKGAGGALSGSGSHSCKILYVFENWNDLRALARPFFSSLDGTRESRVRKRPS